MPPTGEAPSFREARAPSTGWPGHLFGICLRARTHTHTNTLFAVLCECLYGLSLGLLRVNRCTPFIWTANISEVFTVPALLQNGGPLTGAIFGRNRHCRGPGEGQSLHSAYPVTKCAPKTITVLSTGGVQTPILTPNPPPPLGGPKCGGGLDHIWSKPGAEGAGNFFSVYGGG